MSDLLDHYCRSYFVTSIINICQEIGFFQLLDKNKFRGWVELCKKSGANPGYLLLVVQILKAAGLVEQKKSSYRLAVDIDAVLSQDVIHLYKTDPAQLLSDNQSIEILSTVIKTILNGYEENVSGDPMENALIIPLLIALKEIDADNFCAALDIVNPELSQVVGQLFIHKKWLAINRLQLTVTGKQLFEDTLLNRALAFSPMLCNIKELLCGNASARASGIEEWMKLQATLGSTGYLKDLESDIIDIFASYPFDQQPDNLVTINAEKLLDIISGVIRDKTPRGKHLQQRPIRLLDADALFSETASLGILDEKFTYGMERTPVSIEEIYLPHTLYVSFFISNQLRIDRKFNGENQNSIAILARDHATCYVDDEGHIIDAHTVLHNWQQYFLNWAQLANDSTFLVWETHCTPLGGYREIAPEPTNTSFEIFRNFYQRYPISAEAFIVLAARAGLFNQGHAKRYPESALFCDASFHRLQKRDYIIRYVAITDLDILVQLEKLCWQHTQTPSDIIYNRIMTYPQGQFVLEKDGRVSGVIYSQRIRDLISLDSYNAKNIHELHRDDGSIIQLLAINIDPQVQNLGLGDQLLEFMLQRCSLVSGITQVAGITLCKNFSSQRGISFEDYIKQEGDKQDPVLSFHQSHGAKVIRAIANYREEDIANAGQGVLVLYNIHHRSGMTGRKPHEEKITGGNEQVNQFIRHKIEQLLGDEKGAYDIDRPLMEMGLDSADLLTLQKHLENNYSQRLKPGFFFHYNNPRKVISYLEDLLQTCSEGENPGKQQEQIKREAAARPTASMGEIRSTDIAIVGVSCRLPGGIDCPDKLWQVLAEGKSVIGSYPDTRGSWPDEPDKQGIKYGGFIDDADAFDASFFRISPAEAQITDPQQRILMELAWSCMENANILPEQLKGTHTGVFIGASNCDYSRLLQSTMIEQQAHHATGSSLAILANRISYFFDFSGPSILIDTACSASLVTLHMAVQSLRSGESNTALVGGVNLICYPDLSIAYHKAGMLAPDGRCKVFDASANGYVRSEGAVMMILKPLHDALADGNSIKAVIKGSAVNHGGLAGGLTVPNPQKQSELLISAWGNARISPRDLSYLEAHGTGTSLGDPLEIQGIQMANAQLDKSEQITNCAIGSVKSNLGHLEAAAGIVGLLKVILSFQHQKIPASINFEKLNPKINFDDPVFYISNSLHTWNLNQRRLAGVSSFGSGGSNAHVVVEEWAGAHQSTRQSGIPLFILSAKNKERLLAYAECVLNWIRSSVGQISFVDFIYTFQTARTFMDERLAIQANSFAELEKLLQDWLTTGEAAAFICHNNVKNAIHRSSAQSINSGNWNLQDVSGKENLSALACAWTSGTDVNFQALYEAPVKKIVVPGYPFAKSRYWVSARVHSNDPVEHPLLGKKTETSHGSSFLKLWPSIPEFFLFRQNDFSCLSMGFILELLLAMGEKSLPGLQVTCFKDIRFFPFYIDNFSPITCEIRSFHRANTLSVEIFKLIGTSRQLIADATLEYANKQAFPENSLTENVDVISIDEDKDNYYMPMVSLNTVFPALLTNTLSPCIFIPMITLHNSSNTEHSLLISLYANKIAIFSSTKKPILLIHRADRQV